jgi:hypothetical protein
MDLTILGNRKGISLPQLGHWPETGAWPSATVRSRPTWPDWHSSAGPTCLAWPGMGRSTRAHPEWLARGLARGGADTTMTLARSMVGEQRSDDEKVFTERLKVVWRTCPAIREAPTRVE